LVHGGSRGRRRNTTDPADCGIDASGVITRAMAASITFGDVKLIGSNADSRATGSLRSPPSNTEG
jgi:hypothetical protein